MRRAALFAFLILLPGIVSYTWYTASLRPRDPESAVRRSVEIRSGMSTDAIAAKLEEEGIDAAVAYYHTLYADQPEGYNFEESQLNRLGYKLLQKQRLDEAVAIFKLNAEAYPSSANVFSSLGEAYAVLGQKDQAIANLKRSLAMDPQNTVALEILRHFN